MALKTSDFDYELPPELIAQHPMPRRDQSRMMVVRRDAGTIEHKCFVDLPGFLLAGDMLVLNDTRVIPARILGNRPETGGKVELLLLEERAGAGEGEGESDQLSVISDQCSEGSDQLSVISDQCSEGSDQLSVISDQCSGRSDQLSPKTRTWTALCRAGWKPKVGIRLSLADGRIDGVITGVGEEGKITVELSANRPLMEVLAAYGEVPLPPYIKREHPDHILNAQHPTSNVQRPTPPDRPSTINHQPFSGDRSRYQTIYAQVPGAVAAPTAGLHFTEEVLSELQAGGVRRATVTLHVGPGTFRPVKTESVAEHNMDGERYRVDEEAALAINTARREGGRIVAVGSTSVRTLETVVTDDGTVEAGSGRSSLFIYPPFRFQAVEAMLTNFHLPRSTLIMMVSAFAGVDLVRHAYEEAVKEKYRFYSYGDCMLIV